MIFTKGGWRWPSRGRVCAASTRGWALAGPGPMRRRDGTCEGGREEISFFEVEFFFS